MKKKILAIAVLVLLVVSVGFNVYQAFFSFDSYLQDPEEIYIMEAGILFVNLEFAEGNRYELQYEFDHPDYEILRDKYDLEGVAKDGTELEKALRIMKEFAPRLTHASNYDNHISINALDLLEYSLDNKNQGINCRNKAQILNEMLLALGIYARKVWIMPYSRYDNDCHVVNEVYGTALNKWVMLDITNNEYWVDEKGQPLSVLEIREKLALREFCTPVEAGEKLDHLSRLKEKHLGDFLYIAKNLVYTEYCASYTVGESNTIYLLRPQNLPFTVEESMIFSEDAIQCSPIQ